MGQKVNPHGLRVGVIDGWNAHWYADKKTFGDTLVEDRKIREFVLKAVEPIAKKNSKKPVDESRTNVAGVSDIIIDRKGADKIAVTVRTERNEQIAEVVVDANGEMYRAESEEKDLYASIDKVIDILEGQIRKAKTKKEKMMREGSIKELNQEVAPKKEITNEILKYGYYEIKPLAPEDAMLELQERPTHNFLPFINLETNKVCVIYKLKDGKNYGIVEPEA